MLLLTCELVPVRILLQACELVKRNVDRYHRHMSTVRDHLEQQLQVSQLDFIFNDYCHTLNIDEIDSSCGTTLTALFLK